MTAYQHLEGTSLWPTILLQGIESIDPLVQGHRTLNRGTVSGSKRLQTTGMFTKGHRLKEGLYLHTGEDYGAMKENNIY